MFSIKMKDLAVYYIGNTKSTIRAWFGHLNHAYIFASFGSMSS